MGFESVELGRSQSDTLAVTCASEFLSRQVALAENIVVLEELKNSNSVFLHDLLDFGHKCLVVIYTVKVRKSVSESGLGASSIAIDYVLKAVGVTEELCVLYSVVFVAVNKRDSVDFLLTDLEAERIENLSENLGSHLKGAKGVSVLEEALSIKSVLPDDFAELVDNLLAECCVSSGGLTSAIGGGGASFANSSVKVLFETLLGENLVNSVREFSPLDMGAFLGGFEGFCEHSKLLLRDWGLRHGQTNAELSSGDETGAKSIKVAEELGDADSLLLGERANAGNNIVDVIRSVSDDLSLARAGLSFRVIVRAVVEALAHTEELLRTVNILTEVHIVALIDVTLVHVATEQLL